jgi:hypothetical protein
MFAIIWMFLTLRDSRYLNDERRVPREKGQCL